MEFKAIAQERRSVRSFDQRPVREATLRQILAAARIAPSAGNLQAWRLVVVRDAERRQDLARAALGQAFVAEAPLALVFIQDPGPSSRHYGDRGRDLYSLQDATIACTYAQLAATDLGLASCWVGAFDTQEVARIVKARGSLTPIAILSVGYPAEQPAAAPRRPLDELVHRETL